MNERLKVLKVESDPLCWEFWCFSFAPYKERVCACACKRLGIYLHTFSLIKKRLFYSMILKIAAEGRKNVYLHSIQLLQKH